MFEAVFQVEAWTSYTQGRAQEDNTFAPQAHFMNRTTIIMPGDLLSYMQRMLWHIPIASKLWQYG